MGTIVDFKSHHLTTKRMAVMSCKYQNIAHKSLSEEEKIFNDTVDFFVNYNKDKTKLDSDLSRGRSQFKFPTIMSKYRKNVDIFTGIYMYTQEAILLGTTNDSHAWFFNLLEDNSFSTGIISKLNSDLRAFHLFNCKYEKYATQYNSVNKDILTFNKNIIEYKHYISIFNDIKNMF